MQKHKIKSIKSLMTPFPYFIDVSESVLKAKQMMAEHKIRHLPVSKDGKLVGVVSDRDLQWVFAMVGANRMSGENDIEIEDVYQKDVYHVEMTERCDNVIAHMAEKHIGSALITKEGKLVGIYTTTDACRDFAELLRVYFPSDNAEGDLA